MAKPLFSETMWFDEITSTNDFLKERCKKQPENGLCAAALAQTKGRGRTGRSFCSKQGGVYFSFSLCSPLPAKFVPAITLLAGLSVHNAIAALTGIETEIKWPNDLLWQKKKLCGILTEGQMRSDGRLDYAVCGIGMNLSGSRNAFPEELRSIVCTLEEAGGDVTPKAFVEAVLSAFEALWQNGLFYHHMEEIMAAYSAHLAWRGEEVRLIRGSETVSGKLVGVNDEGEMLLLHDGLLDAFPSGEIHLRPVKICAFSGNRALSHTREQIFTALTEAIGKLVEAGFTHFRTGGAGGFDTLAALAVLQLKEKHPDLFLDLLLPYPEFAPDDPDFAETVQRADRVTAVSQHYTPFCMALRNEALVEGSDLLLLYNYQSKGGTVQTANFAQKHHVPVWQLPL